MPKILLSLIILPALLLAPISAASSPVFQGIAQLPPPVLPEPYPFSNRYPVLIDLPDATSAQSLYALDLDIDNLQPVSGNRVFVTAYIDPSEAAILQLLGVNFVPIPNQGYRSFLAYGSGSGSPEAWPSFSEYVTRMQALETAHPNIVDLVIIGYSVQNRPLYCLDITDNPGVDEYEPEFKYTANHHGDETTGVEMTMRLAEMLVNSYGSDPTLTALVDNMEIWLCPIYNPDGYVAGSRYNAHGVDLNRDFPDRFTDPIDDPAGREPETQAFMNFGYAHRFVMGANYHGGAQVLNYPWDAVANYYNPDYAPDDQLFYNFGYGYTHRNSDLWGGGWPYGMTRGWYWYMIYGGMQDWAYLYRGEHHVTLEISDNKSPAFNLMDGYWNRNRDAMLWWMSQSLTGFRGLVLDARNSAPLDALVTVNGMTQPNFARTDPGLGDYHRVILAGDYTLTATADGFIAQSAPVTVISGTVTTRDFFLCPVDLVTLDGTITQAGTGIPLSANLDLLGSPITTVTNPATGDYSVQVCPGDYTLRASAQYHYPEDRFVSINQNTTQDFALVAYPELPPDLSPSIKTASTSLALPGDTIYYQVSVINAGNPVSASITDTLPSGVEWSGYLTATLGTPGFNNGQITWQGLAEPLQPVTVTYGVNLLQCLPANLSLLNLVELSGSETGTITRTAEVLVANGLPSMPANPDPADGALNQPVSITLSWDASSDLNCDPITYDIYFGQVNPPPFYASTTNTFYNPVPLLPAITYYWSITARDGINQTVGSIWSFTTGLSWQIFLPLVIR